MRNKSRSQTLVASSILAAMCLSMTAFASVNGEVELGISSKQFDYREFDTSGTLLDKEDGILPGVKLAARLFSGAYFIGLGLDYSHGQADYQAHLAGTRLSTTTDETITDLSLSAGRRWVFNNQFSLTSALSYGERLWRRDIHSTAAASGLLEDYHWPYMGVSFEGCYAIDNKQTLALTLGWQQTQHADMRVEFKSGQFDDTTLDLPNGDGYQVGLRWNYQWRSQLVLSLSPVYRTWDMPRSDAVLLFNQGNQTGSRATEPASETQVIEVIFSLKKQW